MMFFIGHKKQFAKQQSNQKDSVYNNSNKTEL